MLKLYYGHIRLVQDQSVFDKWFEKMDSKRREKVLRCQNEMDRQRSLLAGILLHIGVESDHKDTPFFYSISHSGDYVVCVLSNRSVGIDIENKFRSIFSKEKKESLERIARKCLTFEEQILFQTCDAREKADVLLHFWTRKESYSKAKGIGLGMDFSTIDTEKFDELYWSDWLEEGYYCSLYVEDGVFSDLKLQEIITL